MQRTRKKIRLTGYDYDRPGCYFITVCVGQRAPMLGNVIHPRTDNVGRDDPGAPFVELSKYGNIVKSFLESIPQAYSNVSVDRYVIMPNHIHLILRISCSAGNPCAGGAPRSSRPTQTVPRVMAALKRFTNKEAGFDLWQKSYHDHIIRSEADYLRIWQYIDTNPLKWKDDCYYDPI